MESKRRPLQTSIPSWTSIARLAAASVVGALSVPCGKATACNASNVAKPFSSTPLAELTIVQSALDGLQTTGTIKISTAYAPFFTPYTSKPEENVHSDDRHDEYQSNRKLHLYSSLEKCEGDELIQAQSRPIHVTEDDACLDRVQVQGHSSVRQSMTRMQQLVSTLRWCLSDLGAMTNVTDLQLESYATVVYESMSAPSRTFHSLQHVFDISSGADPIQTIAALFHDVVYFTADGGLPLGERDMLRGILVDGENSILLSNRDFEVEDPVIAMVMAIFGIERGQQLDPYKGLNEFLSAAVAVKSLENTMTPLHLAQIAACIEATIPFRPIDEQGLSPYDHLFERMHKVNSKYRLGMDDEDILMATRRSVDLANRDVQNFASCDPGAFILKALELLPESNVGLRHNTVFRISSFSKAITNMAGFFASLDASVVFRTFRQYTGNEGNEGIFARSVERMIQRASRNTKIATTYMRAELLSSFVLGALAQLTGGDAPMALFLGDSNPACASFVESPSAEDYIVVGPPKCGMHDSVVFELLNEGREELCQYVPEMESVFGVDQCDRTLKRLPLAAYLYAMLGDEGLDRALQATNMTHPSDNESALRLLHILPDEAVSHVASACAKVARTRRNLLMKLAEEYVGLR